MWHRGWIEHQQEVAMTNPVEEIAWRHDFDAALQEADGKLVLLDFSAAPM